MPKSHASFIDPMLLLPAAELPEGSKWLVELKLDGFRAIAFKANGKVHLRSRNDKDFNSRYPLVVRALGEMPDETVIDGEVVALDQDGRPSFTALQNFGSAGATLVYYVFDLMMLRGNDVMAEPLDARRALLEAQVLPTLKEPVRYSPELRARMADLIQSVKAHRRMRPPSSHQGTEAGEPIFCGLWSILWLPCAAIGYYRLRPERIAAFLCV